MHPHYKLIPTHQLQRGIYQPRRVFDEARLRELADSILAQGVIEPLVVRELADQRFEIIAGERRWRAAMMAGLDEVPCLIGTYTDQQAAAITLIENIQRADLNVLEEAGGYHRLQHEFHFTQEEMASLIGKSRSHIANILRLLTLSEPIQALLRDNKLTLGHARALIGLPAPLQSHLAHKILAQDWSVRKLEQQVRHSKLSPAPSAPPSSNADILRLETHIAEQMGFPVKIESDNQQGGWLKIKFFDNDTLTGLLDKMGISYD